MAKMSIKNGDLVEVISGDDKGKTGKVIHLDQAKQRVVVQGVNLRKKHTKQNPQSNQPGGIIDREGPIHSSNVKVIK